MNTVRQTLTTTIQNLQKSILVTLLTITIITSAVPVAHAQTFDLTSASAAPLDQAKTSWSFGKMYNDIFNPNLEIVDVTPLQTNAVFTVTAALPKATPKIANPIVKATYVVEASGYSSEVAQTDDSPFITAKGTHVRDGIIAANFLPFGTVIRIPAIYGDKVFVVEDRMNKRYQNNIDIWFADRISALKFGRKNVKIEIVALR